MSDSKSSSSRGGAGKGAKRSLPSWMSDRDNGSDSRGKKLTGSDDNEENKEDKEKSIGRAGSLGTTDFSKLLEGVVFVLSGFVNPERSTLRSQALEMGAQYQADWNSDCTLLICAFSNTPKFRQVEADSGTIVSKEWISECYKEKKLVDIEIYLLHAGKPWRKGKFLHETGQDKNASSSRKSQKPADKVSCSPPGDRLISKGKASNPPLKPFSPSMVKKWAIDDLHKTISWLESQEEKPELDEIPKIAAEGILTCLQDAIDSFDQNQDIQQMTEQWKFVPRVVEELAKLESNSESKSKNDLCKQAIDCKQIYEVELDNLTHNSPSSSMKKKEQKPGNEQKFDREGYESDDTIEMTEDEIDHAYNSVASKFL